MLLGALTTYKNELVFSSSPIFFQSILWIHIFLIELPISKKWLLSSVLTSLGSSLGHCILNCLQTRYFMFFKESQKFLIKFSTKIFFVLFKSKKFKENNFFFFHFSVTMRHTTNARTFLLLAILTCYLQTRGGVTAAPDEPQIKADDSTPSQVGKTASGKYVVCNVLENLTFLGRLRATCHKNSRDIN